MVDLNEREWALDDYVFGGNTSIKVLGWELGEPAVTVNDKQLPLEDGTVFGRDTVGGFPITLDLLVDETTKAAASVTWRALSGRWGNDPNRVTPGTVLPLRMRLLGTDTVRVYGRPRRMAPGNTGLLSGGALQLTADFMTVDHKYYAEAEQTLTLTLLGGGTGHESSLNEGDTFEDGVDGWTTTGCTITQAAGGTGYEGEHAATLTPDGVTAQVYITSDRFDVSEDVRYHPGVQVKRKAAGVAIPMTTSIRFYDVTDTLISEHTSNATDAVPADWDKATGTFLAPTGSVTAEMRVSYNDATPDAGDEVYIDEARTVELTGFGFPLSFPLQLTGSGKKASAVTTSGDMETWPVLVFEGPITNPTINYVGTDKKLKLTMSIPAGQTVTIDTRPWVRTALRNGIASVAGKLSGSRMAEMALPPGSTLVAFRGQDTTGLSRCRIYWRDAFSAP